MEPAAITTDVIEIMPKIWKVRDSTMFPRPGPKFGAEGLVEEDRAIETLLTVVCPGTSEVAIEITVVFV